MKIKTITCHNVYNYGASLQSYALMSFLEHKGHDVEIIDYMPEYIRRNLSLWAIGPRWNKNIFVRLAFYCYVVPIRLLQFQSRKKFDDFSRRYYHLTRRYESFDELKRDCPIADVYFCGSDQIWNPEIQNGLDPAFYIDFAPSDSIMASYAASFSVSHINDEYRPFIKSLIEHLDFISVRELTGVSIIESLGVTKQVFHVVDPVFLLESSQWFKMTYQPTYSNYILVYDQEDSADIKSIAKSIAKTTNKIIVAFKDLYPRGYADIQIKYAGPIDFISLIAHSDVVITNSFHCSAFSIIFEKDFYVVPRTHQKVNSRMVDLLRILGIEGHIIHHYEDIASAVNIDYKQAHARLNSLRTESENYIDQVLSYKK